MTPDPIGLAGGLNNYQYVPNPTGWVDSLGLAVRSKDEPDSGANAGWGKYATAIDDVRVALIKLAERTCAIRAVKDAPEEKRMRVAREVFDIYAPLAHRLGIGHSKWELEDLSFRYLHASAYKKIAKLLDEKRLDREGYIRRVIDTLQTELQEIGRASCRERV